jgi:hypothetical protein
MNFRSMLAACSIVLALATAGKAVAQAPQQNGFLEDIRGSIVRTVELPDNSVEVAIQGNVLVVLRVNSELNRVSHSARNSDASAIGAVVSKAIADKSEYKNIHTIRVQYVSRAGSRSKVIDTVDFRKNPTGNFPLHAT